MGMGEGERRGWEGDMDNVLKIGLVEVRQRISR